MADPNDPNNPYPGAPPYQGAPQYPPAQPYQGAPGYAPAQPPYDPNQAAYQQYPGAQPPQYPGYPPQYPPGQPYPDQQGYPPQQGYPGQPGYPYPYDPAQAAAAAKKKQQVRWASIAGAVAGLALLAKLSGAFGGGVMACDNSKVQADFVNGMNASYKQRNATFTLTSLTNIATVSHTDQMNSCTATANFSDGDHQPATYTVAANGAVDGRVGSGNPPPAGGAAPNAEGSGLKDSN